MVGRARACDAAAPDDLNIVAELATIDEQTEGNDRPDVQSDGTLDQATGRAAIEEAPVDLFRQHSQGAEGRSRTNPIPCSRQLLETKPVADVPIDNHGTTLNDSNLIREPVVPAKDLESQMFTDDLRMATDRHDLVSAGPFQDHIAQRTENGFRGRGDCETAMAATAVHPDPSEIHRPESSGTGNGTRKDGAEKSPSEIVDLLHFRPG
jgi:hypothetical protein